MTKKYNYRKGTLTSDFYVIEPIQNSINFLVLIVEVGLFDKDCPDLDSSK